MSWEIFKKKSALNYGAMNINVFAETKYVSQIQQKFKKYNLILSYFKSTDLSDPFLDSLQGTENL